jgi:hypothetical protein
MILNKLFRRHKRPVKCYWWTRQRNFGDLLAPLLLERFSDLKNIELTSVGQADIVSVGSVLEHIPAGWTGYIVGSGLLREASKLKFDPYEAKILALRGPLTAKGIRGDFALGDPGLLAAELIEPQEKKWEHGILPHWEDDKLVDKFLAFIPNAKVIKPSDEPLTVLKDIASCKRIVTSSLHGVILSDAFGIERRVETCDALKKDGNLFKFEDYSASVHCPLQIGKLQMAPRNRVMDATSQIYGAYRELGRIYGKR